MVNSKKLYKKVETENGVINIYGCTEVETYYDIPTWSGTGELELAFTIEDRTYFLSEFLNIHNPVYNPNPAPWMMEFDGYTSDSYFSGLLIKLIDNGEWVKVYTYIRSTTHHLR